MVQLGPKLIPMFTIRDMVALGERQHAARRSALIADLNEAAVCDSERVAALRALESERGSFSPLLRWAASSEGAVAVIEYACTKHSIDANAIFACSIEEVVSLAIALMLPPSDGSRAEGKAVAAVQ